MQYVCTFNTLKSEEYNVAIAVKITPKPIQCNTNTASETLDKFVKKMTLVSDDHLRYHQPGLHAL